MVVKDKYMWDGTEVQNLGTPTLNPFLTASGRQQYGQLDMFGRIRRPRTPKVETPHFDDVFDAEQLAMDFDPPSSGGGALVPYAGGLPTVVDKKGGLPAVVNNKSMLPAVPGNGNAGGLVPAGGSGGGNLPAIDMDNMFPNSGGNGGMPKAQGGLKGLFGNLGGAWNNVKSGKGIMPKYAGLAKGAMGIGAGISAVKGINDYQNAKANTDDLVNDILASAAGNDNYRYDLSADQLNTLRQLQNGTYDTSGDFDMGSVLGNIGNIATGAGMGFVTGGGLPGALLGAASGVIDGVSSGMVGNQEKITTDLQSLYDALYESEARNKSMKRDAAMQRYANSLY